MTHQNHFPHGGAVLNALRRGPLRPEDWRPIAASRESLIASVGHLRKKGFTIQGVTVEGRPAGRGRGTVAVYKLTGEPNAEA